jgi:hypothetical protein
VHENVLQIPRSAIVEDMGNQTVFVIEDGKAVRRVVQTGYGGSGMVEITNGLGEDDAVVTVGQVGLKPDAKVSVINAPANEQSTEEDEADETAEPPAEETPADEDED